MQTLLLDRRTQDTIEGAVPDGEALAGLVRFYSIFADPTRIRILSALAISELCVTDISRVLRINQTTVSHQLRFRKTISCQMGCIFWVIELFFPGGRANICARPPLFAIIFANDLKIFCKACIMKI